MDIKQWIHDFWIERYLKGKSFESSGDPGGSKGIGVLFSAESLAHQQSALLFVEELEKKSTENIHLFGYVHRKLEEQVTFAFSHFSLADCKVRPDFSKHKLNIFMQRNYKTCINLDLNNYPILHYVVEKTRAQHKMAINPSYPELYDIIVQMDPDDDLQGHIDKTLDIFEKTAGNEVG